MVLALGYTRELVLCVDRGVSVGGDDSGVVSRVTSEVELSVGNVGLRRDSTCGGVVAEDIGFR